MLHCIFFYSFVREVISKNSCFVFHQGFQTPKNNKWACGLVLSSVFLEPLRKHVARVFDILHEMS